MLPMVDLSFLTDSEREQILEVLRRDEELRQAEKQRVRRLKAELLEIRRKGAKRGSGNYSRQTCGRCQKPLGRLATSASQCLSCNHRVCQNCCSVRPWVCSVCDKEADLKKCTGDWFYDLRINRFSDSPGHDIVRTSLRKRPESSKRETVGELLLQDKVISSPQRPRISRPKQIDLDDEKTIYWQQCLQSVPDTAGKELCPPSKASEAPDPLEPPQRSDTESMEKTSLNSFKTETESSRCTPVLPQREGVVEGQSTTRLSPVGSCVSTLTVPVRADDACRSSDADAASIPQGVPVCGVNPVDGAMFKRNSRKPRKTSDTCRPTSVMELRAGGDDVKGTHMGDRSKSVPGLNVEEEEEEEDIDSLVESHRRCTGGSTLSLRGSKRTLGSLMSVYSDAGDYVSVEVSGEVVFSLGYDERSQIFAVLVKECRGLACGDARRKLSNPYVKCYLLPDQSRQSKRRTTTKRNTVNPIYNETLKYSITQSQLLTRSLQLSVWHRARIGRNAFLGEVDLPLDCTHLDSAHVECVTLKGKVVPSAFAQDKGELVISLKYVSKHESHTKEKKGWKKKKEEERGELHVLIKEAKHLVAMKAGGTSDSFVKGYLLPCKTKATKRKTPVVKKTVDPHYDYTFVYGGLRLEELQSMCLELTVWDWEAVTSNDFLGGVRLSSAASSAEGEGAGWDSTGEEACLWQTMMQYPDSWAEGTLPLRSSMAKSK